MSEIPIIGQGDKTAKAFGGCTKCYGKGYATQMDELGTGKTVINTCTCDRGHQIDVLLENTHREAIRNLLHESREQLPEYIEEKFPKGKAKDRGAATVIITEFLSEMGKALGI